MIQTKNKKFGKRYIAIAATALTLVLLIVAYIVINAVLSGLLQSSEGPKTELPEILEGEAIYGSMAMIYPYIDPDSILAVKVTTNTEENGEPVKDVYMMSKLNDDEGNPLDYFIFSYEDPFSRETKIYYPDILYEDANFSYSDLYAVEQSNSLGVRKIDYLCAAIGALYFEERIPLSTAGEEERAAQLSRYGLSEEDRDVISISYLDENGEKQFHTVYVGNNLITGVGYYFMLAGRDYIYTSSASQTLSYALGGFEAFIDARIIAAEGENDKGAAPYHTGRYNQWVSKYYNDKTLTVPSGVDVVISANYSQPIYADITDEDEETLGYGTGYRHNLGNKLTVTNKTAFKELLSTLAGKNVGAFDENLIYTVIYNTNSAVLFDEEKNEGVYEYTILGIEAIITDSGDITEIGTGIPEGSKIKIEYTYTVDGVRPSRENSHAVIDLSADSSIPADVREALSGALIGNLDTPITYEAKYSQDNTETYKMTMVISEISLILEPNESGTSATVGEKITENSLVNIEYYYLINGESIGESMKRTILLSDIDEDHADYKLKQLLIGKTLNDRNLSTFSEIYCQPYMDFCTYEIEGIEGYLELEETVRFSFIPESQRDPFYAESIYKNTLPSSNKYSTYAMNNEACDEVLRILGGISSDSSSTGADGLVGTETVAVGLSHDVMVKYKLYDGYRIYFELPRELSSSGSSYTWLDKIGFTLYIGTELQPDGTVYVASDMYGIVVKIDPSTFDYLKLSFPEYWARRSLALIDVADIENISLELDFEDLYGEYNFELEHEVLYIDSVGGSFDKPEEGEYSEYDWITVTVSTLSDRVTDSLFLQLAKEADSNFFKLNNIYNIAGGNSSDQNIMASNDVLGTSQMKELLTLIYSTYFLGVLSEEEQSKANSSNKIMELEFDLGDKSNYKYHYDFYRIEDRKIMVSLYRVDSDGRPLEAVSDLYISEFALRKIVSGFQSLLNGQVIDPNKAY